MDASYHLGRQPIVNRKGELVAYELLFRSGQQNHAQVTDDFLATAHVIQNAFTQIGLNQVLGHRLGFINVNADLLMSDVLELLPKQQIVLEILETVKITPDLIKRCIELHHQGFQIALDDVIEITPEYKPLLPHIQFIKLDLLAATPAQIGKAIKELERYRIKLLAEKIDSPEQRDNCMKLGFDLFQGYFFAKPIIISGQKPSPSQTALLKLLNLVHSDAETDAIETAFKLAPDLTVNLLKLVNSVACGLNCKIDSVARAVTVLGRKQIERWVQLLMFTQQAGERGSADPLAQTAAIRGRLMELIAKQRFPYNQELPDKAFMVGMFSLLEALFHMPLKELITPLNLSDDVRDALLEHRGPLGQMLAHAADMEGACPAGQGDFPGCAPLLLEAMAWANNLDARPKG
ncbi:EAL and modified HD-GYP domain-containing signal transduction protein [Formivibrio citricus]|uniref:EAL and modified HD-GYP domain-containing signal transduction protein n=1 Tax=Formivibrio citricus TaxID=83765 RepID=A0A1I4WLK9_9NEIS|nr:EAL domain-containing protein [Formivibrio citricus]SFN14092.1 EAL and modified HD-GYP domain-containing signal transduction protein [Formivibrio citricus]